MTPADAAAEFDRRCAASSAPLRDLAARGNWNAQVAVEEMDRGRRMFDEAQVPVRKVAVWLPVSAEMWREMDRERRPWLYPDRTPSVVVQLFPHWDAAVDAVRTLRGRLLLAGRVLRHGALLDEWDGA